MTGYFSRLAERTGLGFAAHSAQRARGGNAHASSTEFAPERVAPAAPLHAEEITFVSQPEGGAREAFGQSAGEGFHDDVREREGERARLRSENSRAGDFTNDAASLSSATGAPHDYETQTPRTRRADSDRPLQSFPEQSGIHIETSAPQRRTSSERGVENYETADGARELQRRANAAKESLPFGIDQARPREPQQPAQATRETPNDFAAPLDAEAIGGMSRTEIYQTYLREVRKWVAEEAPAILDEAASRERSRVAAAEDDFGVSLEREPVTQDFNLSIGTISIVVEEPPAQTVVQPAPPQRAERAPAPRAARSSGRNYLRFK